MTFTATRGLLATALDTVEGISGFSKRPATLKIGAAWPLLEVANRGPGDSFEGTWRVLVFCGGSEHTATDFLDTKLPLIVAVLDPIAYVDAARPALTKVNGTDAYVVEVICRSE